MSLGIIIVLSSCKQQYKTEINHINNLKDSIALNSKKLEFDIAPFQARVSEMDDNINQLKYAIKDTLTLEMGSQFDRYKGITKIYKSNIKRYKFCKTETIELTAQLNNLLIDINNNKLGKKEIKEFYRKEKLDVLNLIESTKGIHPSILEVESEFRRLSKIVFEQIAKEKAEN